MTDFHVSRNSSSAAVCTTVMGAHGLTMCTDEQIVPPAAAQASAACSCGDCRRAQDKERGMCSHACSAQHLPAFAPAVHDSARTTCNNTPVACAKPGESLYATTAIKFICHRHPLQMSATSAVSAY